MRVPAGGSGRLGTVVYDGDRGLAGDSVAFEPHPGRTEPLTGSATTPGDAFDSTVADFGGPPPAACPPTPTPSATTPT
ncbi:hypothetical protein [Streptomyces somaliensis]|uniref:hypothetical protein n=1 Tax=Streptomyces somaliensis TaxID=78355 RepID=UPI0034E93689